MRSFAILAAIYAATAGTTSGKKQMHYWLRTVVSVKATGSDERTSGNGCSPDGREPDNTQDGSRSANSRWSCQGGILDSSDDDRGCCIAYGFAEPQDIVRTRISFHKGGENTRTLDVYDNGRYHSQFTSSGFTLGIQTHSLNTDEIKEIKLCLTHPELNSSVLLSITEVKFMVI